MSLLAFHRVLIAAGVVFCFGFAASQALGLGGVARSPWVAVVFAVLGLGLLLYFLRMRRVLGYEEEQDGGKRPA
jgi:hypothetical protein